MSDARPENEMVINAAKMLGEHFDSVQIFCTRHEGGPDGGTFSTSRGVGNFYARYGQVREWLLEQDSKTGVPTEDEK